MIFNLIPPASPLCPGSFHQILKSFCRIEPRQEIQPREHHFEAHGDEMVDEASLEEQQAIEKACASGDCSQMPGFQKLKVKVGYEDSFRNSFASAADVDTYLNAMMTHVQAHYCLDSLGTKVAVEVRKFVITKLNDLANHLFLKHFPIVFWFLLRVQKISRWGGVQKVFL